MLSLHSHARPRPPLTSPVRKVSHDILCLLLAELILRLCKGSLLTLEAVGSLSNVLPPAGCRSKVLEFILLTLLVNLSGKLTTQRRTCTTHNRSHLTI
jgi:hypothetical protein